MQKVRGDACAKTKEPSLQKKETRSLSVVSAELKTFISFFAACGRPHVPVLCGTLVYLSTFSRSLSNKN